MNLLKTFRPHLTCGMMAMAAALWGCTSDANDTLELPGQRSSGYNSSYNDDPITDVDYEMYENYLYLDVFYSYGHIDNELGEFEDYYKKGSITSDGWSYCTQKYGNVCYMYHQMQDNFTRYFDPNYAEQVLSMLMETEDIVGIGAEAKSKNDTLFVSAVYDDSPAEKAGLEEGDVILHINGKTPSEETFEKYSNGTSGGSVVLEIARNDSTFKLDIRFEAFKAPTVFLSYEDSIPVIRIDQFVPNTVSDSGSYGEFVRMLRKTSDAKSTIIDLRGNPGGDGAQCNNISAELLSKGDTIIIDIETNVDSTYSRGEYEYFQKFDTTTYIASEDGIGKGRYYVFLADSNSASCAEVMLSSITVNLKTPVVGQISYGKGIGQYILPTSGNGLALISGLRTFDKDWGIYHRFGIAPDYPIDDPEKQMAKAVELAKEATEKRTAGYGTVSTGHFAKKARQQAVNAAFPATAKELIGQLGKYSFKKASK